MTRKKKGLKNMYLWHPCSIIDAFEMYQLGTSPDSKAAHSDEKCDIAMENCKQ